MAFNEDTRVKIPAILHLIQLGYGYLSLKNLTWDTTSNIFPEIFVSALQKINPTASQEDIKRTLADLKLLLDNDDLGKAFYHRLLDSSQLKVIDFKNFANNTFNVVTELTYKKDDEEFRPDITLLINGLPLIFIEVKKPNNDGGLLVEKDRMDARFSNPKFKRFANITQFMLFSNNMEYQEDDPRPIQGAFYASSSYKKHIFNFFREEETFNLETLLQPLSEEQEVLVLQDTNKPSLRYQAEFITNKSPNTPTNRICTSLLSQQRLAFMLRYALAYVNEVKDDGRVEIQKHIMRYPQIFATQALACKLNQGIKKGVIWHTQGSGKTALAYYNTRYLTDYYQEQGTIPKFYFIVDRLDLLNQAKANFEARGLKVHSISSREDFAKDIKSNQAIHNHSGTPEITVVNIHKFQDDPDVIQTGNYNLEIQRVFFIDEAHKSYNPKGSFLANLNNSDPHAIKIGLTGTPLISKDYKTTEIFGDYIHKYYYNKSIADGYTLRLIREAISTHYQQQIQEVLQQIEIQTGDLKRSQIYAHPSFVEPMLDYIVEDFQTNRRANNDPSLGAMVICDSSDQAKTMSEIFNRKYAQQPAANDAFNLDASTTLLKVAEPEAKAWQTQANKKDNPYLATTSALILHDVGTKEERKDQVEAYKKGQIDILFVYNMLLTGFDAPRLKKLYLGRVIKDHNLLQAITRVNRAYKDYRYGYVVDFADIQQEFDDTNKRYAAELQEVLGDELENYSQLFKTEAEIAQTAAEIKATLIHFNTENAEIFSQQISGINNRQQILTIKKALEAAKELYNLIRLQQDFDLLNTLDFYKLNLLLKETNHHLANLNTLESTAKGGYSAELLNRALEEVAFMFTKIGEEELILADQLKDDLRKAREALANNFDQKDPEFISLKEELERLLKKNKIAEVTQQQLQEDLKDAKQLYEQVRQLNHKNQMLSDKFDGDNKYMRNHKRLLENYPHLVEAEAIVFSAFNQVKHQLDELVLNKNDIFANASYFDHSILPILVNNLKNQPPLNFKADDYQHIKSFLANEYTSEYQAKSINY